jgi:hypothetical protein
VEAEPTERGEDVVVMTVLRSLARAGLRRSGVLGGLGPRSRTLRKLLGTLHLLLPKDAFGLVLVVRPA